jgi:hypothetical protein
VPAPDPLRQRQEYQPVSKPATPSPEPFERLEIENLATEAALLSAPKRLGYIVFGFGLGIVALAGLGTTIAGSRKQPVPTQQPAVVQPAKITLPPVASSVDVPPCVPAATSQPQLSPGQPNDPGQQLQQATKSADQQLADIKDFAAGAKTILDGYQQRGFGVGDILPGDTTKIANLRNEVASRKQLVAGAYNTLKGQIDGYSAYHNNAKSACEQNVASLADPVLAANRQQQCSAEDRAAEQSIAGAKLKLKELKTAHDQTLGDIEKSLDGLRSSIEREVKRLQMDANTTAAGKSLDDYMRGMNELLAMFSTPPTVTKTTD